MKEPFNGPSYDSANYTLYRPTYPASVYQYLREYIGLKDDEKVDQVVDLACGTGQATKGLLKSVANKVTAVDPSDNMLAQAAEALAMHKSQVEFVQGSDRDLAEKIAPHSVDLLTFAESAHWFKYPEFWDAAHTILKPGGTLAFWSYYFFYFEGYLESAQIIKDYCLADDKCGPHWDAGQHRLSSLYSEIRLPTSLFKNEVRILNTIDSNTRDGPFELVWKDVKVGSAVALLSTYSAYNNWKKQNKEGKPDILDETTKELLEKTGLTLDSRVTIRFDTVLVCASAK